METALSLSRKAFRLGKFLGNLQKIRDLGERERKRRAEALELRKKDNLLMRLDVVYDVLAYESSEPMLVVR